MVADPYVAVTTVVPYFVVTDVLAVAIAVSDLPTVANADVVAVNTTFTNVGFVTSVVALTAAVADAFADVVAVVADTDDEVTE